MHVIKHFNTITGHRHKVMMLCFRVGLYRQGLLHDLSKYSPTEFWRGCRYYQGNRSPNNYEREINGYSLSWLHHKGRNKHHFEYWVDYDENHPGCVKGMSMPRRYVAEMFCDRVAACKTYQKEKYTDESPARFYFRAMGKFMMHRRVHRELAYLLTMLADSGEAVTLSYIKHSYLRDEKLPEDYIEYATLRDFDEAHGIDTEVRRDGPTEAYMLKEEIALRRWSERIKAEKELDAPDRPTQGAEGGTAPYSLNDDISDSGVPVRPYVNDAPEVGDKAASAGKAGAAGSSEDK